MSTVNVLLSTFNGARYLQPQLESIASQSQSSLKVDIRDDGSEDESVGICTAFANDRQGWRVDAGKNAGVFGSFMKLLADADNSCSYFAFSDQDDIWFKDKLSRAVEKLEEFEGSGVPALYFSRVAIIDSALRVRGFSKRPSRITFASSLVENIAPGCTIVLNTAAREKLIKAVPEDIPLHDWWCYCAISAIGKVIFDPKPGLFHRVHDSNQSYGNRPIVQKSARRVQRLISGNPFILSNQAEKLLGIFGASMPARSKLIAERFVQLKKQHLFNRISFAVKNPYMRQTPFDNLFLKIMYLTGSY